MWVIALLIAFAEPAELGWVYGVEVARVSRRVWILTTKLMLARSFWGIYHLATAIPWIDGGFWLPSVELEASPFGLIVRKRK